MVHLREINAENMWDIAALEVKPEQDWLVTSARDGLVEAWGLTQSGCKVFPFGIYSDNTPVGFILCTYNGMPATINPDISRGNYEINHLLIDKKHQCKGYGRQALRLTVEFLKTMPCGPAEYCWLSYKPVNKIAERIYKSEGFQITDKYNFDEIIAIKKL